LVGAVQTAQVSTLYKTYREGPGDSHPKKLKGLIGWLVMRVAAGDPWVSCSRSQALGDRVGAFVRPQWPRSGLCSQWNHRSHRSGGRLCLSKPVSRNSRL